MVKEEHKMLKNNVRLLRYLMRMENKYQGLILRKILRK